MKKNKKYCCSLYADKEIYMNEMFNSFNEAKEAGIMAIKDFNKNRGKEDYIPDEDIFEDELVNKLANEDTLGIGEIKRFYIHGFSNPEIPENLGEYVVERIDVCYWDEITFAFHEWTLTEHLEEDGIKELSKLIYDFIDEKTENYDYSIMSSSTLVEVEE